MSLFTLARWLGPWADAANAPDVPVADEQLGELRVRIYRERGRACTPVLVAPGLHYAGPDDVRFDRFCRILAAAGHRVIAPFIPSYLALEPDARAIDDFIRVIDALPRWIDRAPIGFSISFGSLLVFAAQVRRPGALARLVVFGGYADFHDTLAFCLTGERRDPLNQPVVLMNLLEHITHDATERAALVAGWRRYVERTWGRPELKATAKFTAIAEALAPSVPASVRELFLVGIGARPGAWPLARAALTRFDDRALDPRPWLAEVTGRVDLVHGADDDVIPVRQVHALAAGLTKADVRVHVTGLYGHTGAGFGKLAALPKELVTMVRVLRALDG